MVFNIKYLFCLSILLSLFKPEMITATAEKKPVIEIYRKVIDVNEYITNPEKSFEALSSHLLTAEESYSLCIAFYSMRDLGNTLAWSMETLRKYKEETTEEHSFTEVDVLEYIAYVHYLIGDTKTALKWTKKLLKLDPNHPRAAGNVPQYEDIIAGHETASRDRGETGDETEDEKANAIKPYDEVHEFHVAKIHLLTAADCYELTQIFYNQQDYNHSLVWSMKSLRKYKEETTEEHSFTEVDVLEYIAHTHYLMGDLKTALEWTKELLKLDPDHPRAAGNVPLYEEAIAREKLSEAMHQFDVAISLQMTAADCFELGKAHFHKNEYNMSLAWYMESLRKYKNETTEEHSFTEVDLLEFIAYTHYFMGDTKPALEWTKKLLKLDPNHPQAVANVPYYEMVIAYKEAATIQEGEKLSEAMYQFDVAKSLQMTAADCFELGKALFYKDEYNMSLAWNMESLRKYKNETTEEHSFPEVDLLEYIAYTHYLIGDIKPALEWTKKLLELDPNHPQGVVNAPYYEKVIAYKEAEGSKKGENTWDEYEDETKEMPEFDIAISRLMTADGCFNLCKDFYFNNDFNNALAWGMEALHKYKEETGKKHSFTEVEVLEYIAFSHNKMGDLKPALDWTKKLLKLDPNHPRAAGNVPLYEKAIAEQEAVNKKRWDTGDECEDETTEDETEEIPRFDIAKSHLMTTAACFKLCKDFYFKTDFKNSLVWSMETLHKYRAETNKEHSFTEVDVLEYIGFSHYMMGDLKTALEWIQQLLKLDPNHPRAAKHVSHFEKAIAEQEAAKKKRLGTGVPSKDEKDEIAKPDQIISKVDEFGPSYPPIKRRYEALCRGEMEINSHVAKRLFCRYMSETHPFLRLAPIKAEQVYIDPDVFVFHGVLSDDEIQVIKVLSLPRLERATVNNKVSVVNYRISKSAWVSDQESQVVARVSQRVADMTGLSMESAEDLHVINYGIGGHYEPHFDFPGKNQNPFPQQEGNRIATVLFYMSDVVEGGATVFTELGLSVHPERGAALFFINLHPSGEGDTATRHGACPVLRGSKWVGNKWIHEGGQELIKPCSWDCQIEETIRKIPRAARTPI